MAPVYLPEAFSMLEPFREKWDLPDFNARYGARLASSFEELRAFHAAMMQHGPDILAYLDSKPIDAFTEADRSLGRLMYALSVVAQAVEVFKQVRVPDTDNVRLTLVDEYQL